MKQSNSTHDRIFWSAFPKVLFAIAVALNFITTYYVTGHYLDSDTSSTLLFSQHLAEIGKLFSQDWYYSTSIEVVSSHLVYMPLFCLLDNWRYIRLIGTFILQALYLSSYAFMLHQAGMSKRVFYISAALLLLPVSVSYGRIVLYHCYYIPLFVTAFVMLGLVFGAAKSHNWKSLRFYLTVIMLAAVSFLGGLGGVRHLMITHAPMVLSAFVFCFLDYYKNEQKLSTVLRSDRFRLLFYSVLSAGASLLGYVMNVVYLSKRYSFSSYNSTMLSIINFSEIGEILHGYFHQFGFRKEVSMLSLTGIISLLGFVAGIYCIYVSVQIIKQYNKDSDIYKAILSTFFLYFTSVTVFVFLVTGGEQSYYHSLYLVFCIPWAAPLLISSHENTCTGIGFSLQKAFSWITVLSLCVNGLANMTYFNGNKTFDQVYEGLAFQDMDKKEKLSGAVEYLSENDYDIGYATYWEGNVTTEITNGQIPMINILMNETDGNLAYFNWLTSQYLREVENRKPFLLISSDWQNIFQSSDSYQYCKLVYEDNWHCVYDIMDIDAFIPTLYY